MLSLLRLRLPLLSLFWKFLTAGKQSNMRLGKLSTLPWVKLAAVAESKRLKT